MPWMQVEHRDLREILVASQSVFFYSICPTLSKKGSVFNSTSLFSSWSAAVTEALGIKTKKATRKLNKGPARAKKSHNIS